MGVVWHRGLSVLVGTGVVGGALSPPATVAASTPRRPRSRRPLGSCPSRTCLGTWCPSAVLSAPRPSGGSTSAPPSTPPAPPDERAHRADCPGPAGRTALPALPRGARTSTGGRGALACDCPACRCPLRLLPAPRGAGTRTPRCPADRPGPQMGRPALSPRRCATGGLVVSPGAGWPGRTGGSIGPPVALGSGVPRGALR